MKISTKFFILFFTLTLSFSGYSQTDNLLFTRIGQVQGVPHGFINAFVQDSLGYIWIGAQGGLCKYDGYTFKQYRHNEQDSTSISNDEIWSLLIDSKHRLWVGTSTGGLNMFDYEKDLFKQYVPETGKIGKLGAGAVRTICEDLDGNIWCGTWGSGLYRFNEDLSTFTNYIPNEKDSTSLNNNIVLSIVCRKKGELWVGTYGGGINIMDIKDGTFSHLKHEPNNKSSVSSDWINDLYFDKAQNLWVATKDKGVCKYNLLTKQFKVYQHQSNNPNSISSNNTYKIIEDKFGSLWILLLEGGINRFDPQTNIFTYHKNKAGKQRSLSHGRIQSLFQDNSGLIWLGSMYGEISIHDPNTRHFSETSAQANLDKLLNFKDLIYFLKTEPSTIWLGTFTQGMVMYDLNTGTYTNFSQQAKAPYYLNKNVVPGILIDSDSTLWASNFGGGLYSFNIKNKSSKIYTKEQKHSLNNNYVNPLAIDKKGNLWIGTSGGGLNKLEIKTGKFSYFVHSPKNDRSISANYINYLFFDSNDKLWVATNGRGINRYEEKEGLFIRYYSNKDDSTSIPSDKAMFFLEDSNGDLWIGFDGGLSLWNKKKDNFTNYTVKDGLCNNSICCILEDEKQNLWISTGNGISKFSLNDRKFTNFDKNDGLQANEFNHPVGFKDKDSKMYFGGINGINTFYPDSIIINTSVPKVVISDFTLNHVSVKANESIDGNIILTKNINLTKNIELDYNQKVFGFEFTAINFRNALKNQFAYKLEGFDKNWNKTNYANRKATYTNLSPGTYYFKVKASNDRGIWNETGSTIKIIIHPPWWKTWWAISIWVILIAGTILSIYFFRISQLKNQKRVLENTVEERTVEIQAQAEELKTTNEKLVELDNFKESMTGTIVHDLKNPLNVIINTSEKDPVSGIRRIKNTGKQMLNMVLNILDVYKYESSQMLLDRVNFNLNKTIDSAITEIAFLAEQKSLTIQKEIDSEILMDGDEQIMKRVIVNLLTNAIKYSPLNEKLIISLTPDKQNHKVKVSITDKGKGIPQEQQLKIFEKYQQLESKASGDVRSTGLGLTFCKMAIEAHKGVIGVESEIGKGSSFWFILDITQAGVLKETSQDQVADEKDVRIEFNEKEKSYLLPIIEKLKQHVVYETTDITKIMENVDDNFSKNVSLWKQEVEACLFNMNEKKYNELIQI